MAGGTGAGDVHLRRLEHFSRDIETEKPRLRIAFGYQSQITPGAHPDFQHGPARRDIEFADQTVPPEQIIFAGKIIDMALDRILRIHGAGMVHVAAVMLRPARHQPFST